jgi:hypothetical protein
MSIALVEDLRTTHYRQRLADLLRRPSCRWMAFTVGAAPVHRSFFASVAAAVEGLPTGKVQPRNGVAHRQVQYGVRLRVADGDDVQASYDAERDLLVVPGERAFDTLDGQARLVSACVHLGLGLEGRDHQPLDNECAARIAGHLYRLYESIVPDDSELQLVAKLQRLAPASPHDAPFFEAAVDILRHCRATLRANNRRNALQPGSFMRTVHNDERARLRGVLTKVAGWHDRDAHKPVRGGIPRAARFLAFQEQEPVALRA